MSGPPGRATVVVVGAGISGLAAARSLSLAGAHVILVESDDQAGGKLASIQLHGRAVDIGPDAFLARVPEGERLARQVGLGDRLIVPAASKAWLMSDGALHTLPPGLVLGVPTSARALWSSGAVSKLSALRATCDLIPLGQRVRDDTAVGELVRRRLGREVFERLVDPLVGGINAGRSEMLSLQAATPQLAAAFQGRKSLMRSLRGAAAQAPSAGEGRVPTPSTKERPVFWGVSGGMRLLVEALEKDLVGRGADVLHGWHASALRRREGSWLLEGPETLIADGVVLAPPAPATATLLEEVSPSSAAGLRRIEYSSVAVATLAYDEADVGNLPEGSGFLIPRSAGTLATACTFVSRKWPQAAAPGEVLLRISAGRHLDSRAMTMSDEELVARLHGDVAIALGLRAPPLETVVTRWPDAFPQYGVGHLSLVGAIREELSPFESLAIAGAAYGGVGIPACIRQGESAARQVARAMGLTDMAPGRSEPGPSE